MSVKFSSWIVLPFVALRSLNTISFLNIFLLLDLQVQIRLQTSLIPEQASQSIDLSFCRMNSFIFLSFSIKRPSSFHSPATIPWRKCFCSQCFELLSQWAYVLGYESADTRTLHTTIPENISDRFRRKIILSGLLKDSRTISKCFSIFEKKKQDHTD